MNEVAVQRLLDRTEVSDAVREYFMALDRYDWDKVAALVDDMFYLEADAPEVASHPVPRDEFMRGLRARNGGFTSTAHINPDHVVEIDGDTARVTSHCWAAHGVGPNPEDIVWGYGFYHVQLARRHDKWKLTGLRLELVGSFGNAADIFQRSAERQNAGLGRG